MKSLSSKILMLTFLFGFSFPIISQSLAEKLGYEESDKLLIIHSDDIGVSHSENIATFLAMKAGVVNSGSIMMPCPWVPEVAEFKKLYPETDFGLHLTLTAEWKTMKWGPVASKIDVSSLVDKNGYFYDDCLTFGQKADPKEVKIELRAQIEKAIRMGIDPTHLDSHMGCLVFSSPEVFKAYLELGREYKLPVMVSRFFLKAAPQVIKDMITPDDVIIEHTYTAGPEDYKNGMDNYYNDVITNLSGGVSILLIHTAFNDSEMQSLTIDQEYWGANWRQQDFDFFTSKKVKNLLEDNDVKLITWREIKEAFYGK